jgi:transposase
VLLHRTRHHRKVSAIGALAISPRRHRLRWYVRLHPDQAIRQEQVVGFLRQLLRHVRGAVLVVWDRLNAHRGRQVREYVAGRQRLTVEFLPAYAPELNPNEYGWGYLKGNPLANRCPEDVDDLAGAVIAATDGVRCRPDLLRSFVHATHLPIRL